MVKITLAVSIVLLICAAGLGLSTKGKVEAKVKELAATHATLTKTEATLATRTGELQATTENLAAANKEIESKTTQVAKLEDEAKASAAQHESAVKEKDGQIAKLETGLNDANVLVAAAAKDKEKIAALEAQVAETQKSLAETEGAKKHLEDLAKDLEGKLAAFTGKGQRPAARADLAGLNGSVLSVNPGLNFVVLSIGDAQGAAVNAPLLVMRDGQRVATLKITSVEGRTSVADVVPGSTAHGQSVQPGDRVVFAGKRGQEATPVSAPAPAVPVLVPAA